MIDHNFKNLIAVTIFLISIFLLPPIHRALASETIGTIDPSSLYAWGENIGWVNFHPTNAGLTVTDSSITGYAWSQNSGWINFSPSGGSVTNTPSGVLGGYAWSSHNGWIGLSGVSITAEGKFTGTAGTSGSNAGRINFDCTHCDVRTDWRPLAARTVTPQPSRTIGGFASAAVAPALVPSANISMNAPLQFIPSLPGTLLQDTPLGPVIVEVPHNAATEPFVIHVNILPQAEQQNDSPFPDAILIGAAFYEINAIHAKGYELHTFAAPIRITLPLPQKLQNVQRLAVYWYNESAAQWNRIPNVDFTATSASFSVTHFTRFAIFALRSTSTLKEPVLVTTGGGGAIITETQNVPTTGGQLEIRVIPLAKGEDLGRSSGEVHIVKATAAKDIQNIIVITFITMLAYILARRRIDETK